MRPRDLYVEAASFTKPTHTPEEEARNSELFDNLKERTAFILDTLFIKFVEGDDGVTRINVDADDVQIRGLSSHTVKKQNRQDQVRVRSRWVFVNFLADDELQRYSSSPDFEIRQKLLIGVHDLEFSQDSGRTWSERLATESLDVATSLALEPVDKENEVAWRLIEEGEVDDPFEEFAVLERTNTLHPVFGVDLPGLLGIPEPTHKHYDDPIDLLSAINASLDDFETSLSLT